MPDLERRNLDGGRAEIVGECAGEKIAALVIGELLEQRRAEPVYKSAADLTFHDPGIELGPDIVNGGIFFDAERAGLGIDLDRCQINDEAKCRG